MAENLSLEKKRSRKKVRHTTLDELTERQKEMLMKLAKGDEPCSTTAGYFWVEEPEKRFDLRTANSLLRKRLLEYLGTGVGGGLLQIGVGLTKRGEKFATKLVDDEYERRWGR